MNISQRNRRAIATGALVFAVCGTLIAASIVSRQFFEGPSRTAPPHHPQAELAVPAPTLYRVAAIVGAVEALHNGQWYVVQAGDLLPLADVIRTNKGASALLRRGGTEIEVREDVDIRLDSLAAQMSPDRRGDARASAASASFDLLRGGPVLTTVDDPEQTVEIKAAGTRAVNKGIARFVVELGAGGTVTVATAKGEVLFSAKGKEVTVPAGHESRARPGEAPEEPERIPEELLLSVIWPEIDRPDEHAQVTGKVRGSSRVKVNGVDTEVRPDGRFASTVPLTVGPNRLEVEAQDILGHKKSVNKVIRRPPPSPTLETTDEDLWKR
jgi:hypothetical protein